MKKTTLALGLALAAASAAPSVAADRTETLNSGKATLAQLVAASGGDFDKRWFDYDLLLNAVQAADLVDALNDPSVDWTLFAPNDLAFIRLARDLGYAVEARQVYGPPKSGMEGNGSPRIHRRPLPGAAAARLLLLRGYRREQGKVRPAESGGRAPDPAPRGARGKGRCRVHQRGESLLRQAGSRREKTRDDQGLRPHIRGDPPDVGADRGAQESGVAHSRMVYIYPRRSVESCAARDREQCGIMRARDRAATDPESIESGRGRWRQDVRSI